MKEEMFVRQLDNDAVCQDYSRVNDDLSSGSLTEENDQPLSVWVMLEIWDGLALE